MRRPSSRSVDRYLLDEAFQLGRKAFGGSTGPGAAKMSAVNSSVQSIPNSAFTTITGWTEVFDTANAFDPISGIFTVPTTGFYQISGSLLFNTGGVPVGTLFYGIISIANVFALLSTSAFPSPAGNISAAVNGLVHANAGDPIVLRTFQNSGAPHSLNATFVGNYFTIAQIL